MADSDKKNIGGNQDEIAQLRNFSEIRAFFWNLISLKKSFIRKALSAYYAIHKKSTEKLLYRIYKNRNSALFPLFCGMLAGLSQAPIYAFFLLPFAFTTLIRLIDFADNNKSLLKISALFNVGYCIPAFYWPAYGTYVFGFTKNMLPIFASGIIFLSAILPTIAVFAFGLISTQIKPFRRILLFACLWILAEYLRAFVIFHFPFGLIGYSVGFAAFMYQSVSIWGVLGLSFFLVLWSCSFYIVLFTDDKLLFIRYFRTFLIINISGIFVATLGIVRLYNAKTEYYPHKVAIIQGNTSVRTDQLADFETYSKITYKIQELTNGAIDIIIWPESAGVPFNFQKHPKAVEYLDHFILPHQTFIFNGIRNDGNNIFNSMYIYDYETLKYHDKHFLVPYGEYLPIFQKYKFGKAIARSAGIGFSKGQKIKPIKTRHGIILPLICYEVTYSGHIGLANAIKTHYIVNITNDEWFGKTSGPFQHFDTTKFRAAEEGISIVRASNNGFSAVIDPYGRVSSKKTELFKRDVILTKIPKKIPDETLFDIWGNVPLLTFAFFYIQYYILLFLYALHHHKVDGHVSRYLENRDKKKQDPDYKRRF